MDRFSQFDVNIEYIYHIYSTEKTESWKRTFYKKNRLKHGCGYTLSILTAIYKKNYYELLNLNSVLCKVLNFIDREAFKSNINIKELAAQNNLSYEYFIRMFSKEIGCSPKKYINSIRLARVCKLLSETGLPISDVASVSGFFDSSYFFQLFKKTYGLSPVEYREKNRKKYDM